MANKKVGVHGTDKETGRNKGEKTCPITKEQFLANSAPIKIVLWDQVIYANPRGFESGSFGYNANGTVQAKVGETILECQLSLNMIVKYSKPKEGE